MADRLDYYFRQRVSEAELDLAFELLEKADRSMAPDIGVFGVISGAEPTPHSPIADLTIDLTAPARAYDRLGQRIFFGTGQRVDCSVDDSGIPTEITVAGRERWLGVFLRFDRLLSDSPTDGNSQQIYFRRDETFEPVVRQGPEAAVGTAPKVPLQEDELLICDVLRRHRNRCRRLSTRSDGWPGGSGPSWPGPPAAGTASTSTRSTPRASASCSACCAISTTRSRRP